MGLGETMACLHFLEQRDILHTVEFPLLFEVAALVDFSLCSVPLTRCQSAVIEKDR